MNGSQMQTHNHLHLSTQNEETEASVVNFAKNLFKICPNGFYAEITFLSRGLRNVLYVKC